MHDVGDIIIVLVGKIHLRSHTKYWNTSALLVLGPVIFCLLFQGRAIFLPFEGNFSNVPSFLSVYTSCLLLNRGHKQMRWQTSHSCSLHFATAHPGDVVLCNHPRGEAGQPKTLGPNGESYVKAVE